MCMVMCKYVCTAKCIISAGKLLVSGDIGSNALVF